MLQYRYVAGASGTAANLLLLAKLLGLTPPQLAEVRLGLARVTLLLTLTPTPTLTLIPTLNPNPHPNPNSKPQP